MKYPTNTLLSFLVFSLTASSALAGGVSGQGTWEQTLQGRDLDNDGIVDAYYDTTLNITWLKDWNNSKNTGFDPDGRMDWPTAMQWASQLTVGKYSDWRLTKVVDTGPPGCDWSFTGGTDCGENVQTRDEALGITYSEMAHMYYITLGNKSFPNPSTPTALQDGYGLTNTGPFENMQAFYHWTGTEYALEAGRAWNFGMVNGGQNDDHFPDELYAVAVRDGDVSAVPESSTFALAGIGAITALIFARRKSASPIQNSYGSQPALYPPTGQIDT